jgi:hypothetical protein
MQNLRLFPIIVWISLPTVMYGGYALLGLLEKNKLSDAQRTYFRAGHAHAGVLLLMALLYHYYMEQTALSPAIQIGTAIILTVGILAQAGGFFLHLASGKSGGTALGTRVTTLGAVLLAVAVLVLAFGLITAPK